MRHAMLVTLVAALTVADGATLAGQTTARAQVEACLARQQFAATAFGRLGSPPGLADARALALDAGEDEALRLCKPRDCDIRLSGAALTALRARVQWGSPDQAEQVSAFVREAAAEDVTAYQKRGEAVLTTNDDRMRPVSLRGQWQGLRSNSPLLAEYAPDLRDYLSGYPSKPRAAARDIFYWLKENYDKKPVLGWAGCRPWLQAPMQRL